MKMGITPCSDRPLWRFPARHGGTPIASWFISWKNPTKKWMMTGDTAISGFSSMKNCWWFSWDSHELENWKSVVDFLRFLTPESLTMSYPSYSVYVLGSMVVLMVAVPLRLNLFSLCSLSTESFATRCRTLGSHFRNISDAKQKTEPQ